jgi:pilus assembly protein CpaB
MNMTRMLILGAALGAAVLAAFLVRSLIGSQNNAAAMPKMEVAEIVVASRAIEAGTKIMPGDLKWQGWPKSALDASFITKEAQPKALEDAADGSVARIPLVAGEPVTAQKVIKADGAGFMAAVLTPGMRAVGIKLTTERGAGGFILPNDRVDVIMTRKLGNNDGGLGYGASTVLEDVRVLAVDQTSQEEGESKSIVGKTATLELSGAQAETLALAEAMGDLSLSLRSLGKDENAGEDMKRGKGFGMGDEGVVVLRYGIEGRSATTAQE